MDKDFPRISATIDLLKIDKSRAVEKRRTNEQGHEERSLDYTIDLVPLTFKNRKVIKEGVKKDGTTWQNIKAYFVADAQTKDERAQNAKTKYLGTGFTFVDKKQDDADINADQIPF